MPHRAISIMEPPISLGVLAGTATIGGYLGVGTIAAGQIDATTGIALSVVVIAIAAVARMAYRMGISDRKLDELHRRVDEIMRHKP